MCYSETKALNKHVVISISLRISRLSTGFNWNTILVSSVKFNLSKRSPSPSTFSLPAMGNQVICRFCYKDFI